MVGVGWSAPTRVTALWDRPISSSASRSAVTRRSVSSSSWRPPGKEISPAWRRWWSRTLIVCRYVPARVAVAFMRSPFGVGGTSLWMLLRGLERVEHEPGEDLREEVGRLRWHVDARRRHRPNLVDRAGAQEERRV